MGGLPVPSISGLRNGSSSSSFFSASFLLLRRLRKIKKVATAARSKVRTAATMIPTMAPMEMPEDFFDGPATGVVVELIDLRATMCSGLSSIHRF